MKMSKDQPEPDGVKTNKNHNLKHIFHSQQVWNRIVQVLHQKQGTGDITGGKKPCTHTHRWQRILAEV